MELRPRRRYNRREDMDDLRRIATGTVENA